MLFTEINAAADATSKTKLRTWLFLFFILFLQDTILIKQDTRQLSLDLFLQDNYLD